MHLKAASRGLIKLNVVGGNAPTLGQSYGVARFDGFAIAGSKLILFAAHGDRLPDAEMQRYCRKLRPSSRGDRDDC
jgi:hypothetical protein